MRNVLWRGMCTKCKDLALMPSLTPADQPRVSRLRRALVAPLLLVLVGVALPHPAIGETPPLAPAGSDEAGRRRAQAELREAEGVFKAARGVQQAAAKRIPEAVEALTAAKARLAENSAEAQQAAENLAATRARLRELAVASYLGGGSAPSVDQLLRARDHLELARRAALMGTASDIQLEAATAYEAARDAANSEMEADVRAVEKAAAAKARAQTEVAAAEKRVAAAAKEVENRKLLLDLVTAAAPVAPSDIPRLFLDAYRRSAAAMARKSPGCRLSWTAVAAIGKVETNHGRYRGARLALNGDVSPRIIGLQLNGTNNTRQIKDTDLGVLDGDADFDRAVGPMQFIPSTWVRITQDGNGDGNADPNNAYDAALGTGNYLCRATRGGPVDVEEGLRTAFFSYNRSEAYVENVLNWMRTYDAIAEQLPPPPPPPAPAKKKR